MMLLKLIFCRLDSGSDVDSLPGVAGAGQSNLSTGVAALIQDQMVTSPHSPRVRSFSPDQDFIEMDFDPGSDSSDDSDGGDSGQGQDGEEDDNNDDTSDEVTDRLGAVSVEDDDRPVSNSPPGPVHHLVLEPVIVPTNNNHNNKTTECTNCDPPAVAAVANNNSPTHPASAPVLSPTDDVTILMPRSKSLNSSLGDCLVMTSDPPSRIANLSLCGSRLLQREALLFKSEDNSNKDTEMELSVNTKHNLPSTSSTYVSPQIPGAYKAMIWTEKEAVRKQVFHRKY